MKSELEGAALVGPAVVVVVGGDDWDRATQRGGLLARGQHGRRADIGRAVDRGVAVAPVLRGHPLERVVAVGTFLVEGFEVALRGVASAAVADDDRVAALGQFEGAGHDGDQPRTRLFLVVGRPGDDPGHRPTRLVGVDRPVEVGAQDDSVAHRDFEVLLDQHLLDCHSILRYVLDSAERYARKRDSKWGAR